ncbi:hypothetical protein [Bartonella sp. LJL80]
MQKHKSARTNTQGSQNWSWLQRNWRKALRVGIKLRNIVLLALGCSLGALSLGSAALGGYFLRQVKRPQPQPFTPHVHAATDKGEKHHDAENV